MSNSGNRAGAALGPLILVAIGAFMVWMSWLRWPDLIVDFGREVYVPWQLALGEALYRDIAYFNGPLSPYINAAIFKVFGVSIRALELANIFFIGLLTYVVYRVFETNRDRTAPLMAGVMFLVMFAFAKYFPMGSYNFVAPYSHELVHGTLVSFLAIYMLKCYLRGHRLLWIGAAGFFAGLAMLTKVEVAVSAVAAVAAGLLIIMRLERPVPGRVKKAVMIFVSGLMVPVAVSIGFLSFYMGVSAAARGVFGSWLIIATTGIASSSFYTRMMGLDKAGQNLGLVLEYSLGWGLVILVPLAATYLLAGNLRARRYAPAVAFVVSAGVALYFFNSVSWLLIFRPLPLFVVVIIIILSAGLIRAKPDRDYLAKVVPLLSLALFSLLMLLKIALNSQLNGYGFVLAMPGALLTLYMVLAWLPQVIEKRWGTSSVFRASLLAIVIVVFAWHLKEEWRYYRPMTYPVGKGGDTILTYDPKVVGAGYGMNALLANIERIMGPEEGFVVMPEGALVNYLARRPNPTRFINFVPADVQMFGEGTMLAALRGAPPAYLIMISRDTSEYGAAYLGQGYGYGLFSFVSSRYEPVLQIGSADFLVESKGFGQPLGMVVMRRLE